MDKQQTTHHTSITLRFRTVQTIPMYERYNTHLTNTKQNLKSESISIPLTKWPKINTSHYTATQAASTGKQCDTNILNSQLNKLHPIPALSTSPEDFPTDLNGLREAATGFSPLLLRHLQPNHPTTLHVGKAANDSMCLFARLIACLMEPQGNSVLQFCTTKQQQHIHMTNQYLNIT